MNQIELEFPIGSIVKYKKEYGVVVKINNQLMIRWDTRRVNDYEELSGGNWLPIVIESYDFKWINNDGTIKHTENKTVT